MPATGDSGFSQQYVLVLDARTLAPKRFTPLGRQWELVPSSDAIRSALMPWTSPDDKVIAILVSSALCGDDPWAPIAQSRWPSAYVFTPTSTRDLGIRSGWYSEATLRGSLRQRQRLLPEELARRQHQRVGRVPVHAR